MTFRNVAPRFQPVSFPISDSVHHQKYGEGTIIDVVANKLSVDFDRCCTWFLKRRDKSVEIIPFPAHRIVRRDPRWRSRAWWQIGYRGARGAVATGTG
jgi:hypothetical protein